MVKHTKKTEKKFSGKNVEIVEERGHSSIIPAATIIGVVVLLAAVAFFYLGDPEGTITGNVIATHSDTDVVAEVNGEAIIARQVTRAQAFMTTQAGQTVSTETALERLIIDRLLLQEAERRGIVRTTEEAEQQLEALAISQDQTLTDVKEEVIAQGESYDEALEGYREQIIIEQLLGEIAETIEVTEEDGRAYYEENKNRFFEGAPIILPYEEIDGQIHSLIVQERSQEAFALLIAELRESSTVTYAI